MKSPISKLLLASAFALSVHANAATVTQYANNVSIPQVYNSINYSDFLAFNSNLGTLNSVTFYIDSATLSGSFIYNQGSSSTSTLTSFTANLSVWAGSADGPSSHNGLSSGQYNGLSTDLITPTVNLTFSNQTFPNTISRNGSKTFTFDGSQQLISSPISVNVSAGDYNNGTYYAPTFTMLNEIYAVGSQGGNPSITWTGVSGSANLRLVYDYTAASPVPEPSTYGLGLSALALGLVAIRRRSKAKD